MTTEPEIHELPNPGETPGLDEALAALQRSDLTEDDALRIVVEFFDTTLRDGDQSVGNSLTLEQKKVIALLLAWAKIDTIELGFGINQADS